MITWLVVDGNLQIQSISTPYLLSGPKASIVRSLDATRDYGNSKDREDLYQIIQNRDHTELDIAFSFSSNDCKRLTTGQVMALLQNPKVNTNKLKMIYLFFCPFITDEVVLHISNHCPNLTYIGVSCFSLLTGATIEALISNHCNKLTGINASKCNIEYIPEDTGVQVPQLKELDLASNHIQVIPPSIALCNDRRLELCLGSNNPIQRPPREIALGDRGREDRQHPFTGPLWTIHQDRRHPFTGRPWTCQDT